MLAIFFIRFKCHNMLFHTLCRKVSELLYCVLWKCSCPWQIYQGSGLSLSQYYLMIVYIRVEWKCNSTSVKLSNWLRNHLFVCRNILIEHDGRLEWLLQREGADVIWLGIEVDFQFLLQYFSILYVVIGLGTLQLPQKKLLW